MLSDEQKLRISKKVAAANANRQVSGEELLGPAYEGVCKACECCTTIVTEKLELVAIGYATRYVRRQKFGSKADSTGKWNRVEPDKRDLNIFNFHDFRPLDLLYLLVDLPKCLSTLTEDELAVVQKIIVLNRNNFSAVARDLDIDPKTAESRWKMALYKMRRMMGVRI